MRRLLVISFILWGVMSPTNALASVKCVQQFLSQTPYNPGPIDGAWGKKTANALKGFFGQIGQNVDGGLGKKNVKKICEVLNGEQHDEWLNFVSLRLYPIEIDPNQVSTASSRTDFDFSTFEISNEQNWKCNFTLSRKFEEDDAAESLAKGKLEIIDGFLEFKKHRWDTGGMSDSSFLPDEANLMLTKSGLVVGKTPYFDMFVDKGEVALPPVYVSLSDSFDAYRKFPEGESTFHIEGDMSGILEIWGCRKI